MVHDIIFSILDYVEKGGIVMFPIIFISFFMWILIINKLLDFYFEKKEPDREECITKVNSGKFGFAGWQSMIIKKFLKKRSGDTIADHYTLMSLSDSLCSKRYKTIATILILASIAPLLGLLGTVTGMISTFDIISKFGTGNARSLAFGISEALITTQSGLVVAIPGIVLGTILLTISENKSDKIQSFCLGLPFSVTTLLYPEEVINKKNKHEPVYKTVRLDAHREAFSTKPDSAPEQIKKTA